VAEMFCRRVATLTKRARAELEALREAHRAMTERLIANYRAVLERIDPAGPAGAQHRARAGSGPQGGAGRGRVGRAVRRHRPGLGPPRG
jgi:hypothetical protein